MSKNEKFICDYCDAEIGLKRNYIRHINTNKKCLELRQNKIECLWCKNTFTNNNLLKKHKCEADKDAILRKVTMEKDVEINTLKEKLEFFKDGMNSLKDELNSLKEKHSTEIKEYRDKFLELADKNNTTINNTTNAVTYNVALVCDKPLRLDRQRVLKLMIKDCIPSYIIRGEIGLADWFLDSVCRNEDYNLCIECTDKTRKIFKYIDDDDKLRKITGREIISLLTSCFIDFKQSFHWKTFLDRYQEQWETSNDKMTSFLNPSNDFVNYIVDKTHKESPSNLLTVSNID